MSDLQWNSVIFLDLDGTVIKGPFEPAVFPAVLGELARKAGLDPAEARRLVVQENLDRQGDRRVPAVLAMDWDDILATVAARLGVRLESSAVEIARAHAGPPDSFLLEGAHVALEELARDKRGRRALVVATKGLGKYQRPVLDALGLTPLFDDILTPDRHNALKQDAAFYGDWPGRARIRISVGDHYEDDVVAPHRFGFRTIWKVKAEEAALGDYDPLERPERFTYSAAQRTRPDAIILSLLELPRVIERLEKSANV